MPHRPQLQIAVKPQEFFHEKVSQALDSLKIKIDDSIEFYVVNLLCEFIAPTPSEAPSGQSLDPMQTPLALMYKTALESPPADQFRIVKKMGDTSLYFAGYFQDYFNRKTFDIDYYISMGQTAYAHASTLMREQHEQSMTEMYDTLSGKFSELVDVVAEVSDPMASDHAIDILAVYDRWTKTNSDRLRRLLERAGISPVKSPTKTPQ